jgi:hypothetical protein
MQCDIFARPHSSGSGTSLAAASPRAAWSGSAAALYVRPDTLYELVSAADVQSSVSYTGHRWEAGRREAVQHQHHSSAAAQHAHHASWTHKNEMLHMVWISQCVARREVATLQHNAAEVADSCDAECS